MTITTYHAASQYLRLTPAAIRSRVRRGVLPPPPWTTDQLDTATVDQRYVTRTGATAPHGTVSRYSSGCRCRECLDAHNEETTTRHRRLRAEWWAPRAPILLRELAAGTPYADALEAADVTWQAIHHWRRIDHDFGTALDEALMEGRPDVEHGSDHPGYKAGCRCPECRDAHEAHRRPS